MMTPNRTHPKRQTRTVCSHTPWPVHRARKGRAGLRSSSRKAAAFSMSAWKPAWSTSQGPQSTTKRCSHGGTALTSSQRRLVRKAHFPQDFKLIPGRAASEMPLKGKNPHRRASAALKPTDSPLRPMRSSSSVTLKTRFSRSVSLRECTRLPVCPPCWQRPNARHAEILQP